MMCVIDIIEGPAQGKQIWLKETPCLEVGRISVADFSIPVDSHLSRLGRIAFSNQQRVLGSAMISEYLKNT